MLADMRARLAKYEALGKTPDSTVDADAIIAYYADL
jgi:hypothetical protein